LNTARKWVLEHNHYIMLYRWPFSRCGSGLLYVGSQPVIPAHPLVLVAKIGTVWQPILVGFHFCPLVPEKFQVLFCGAQFHAPCNFTALFKIPRKTQPIFPPAPVVRPHFFWVLWQLVSAWTIVVDKLLSVRETVTPGDLPGLHEGVQLSLLLVLRPLGAARIGATATRSEHDGKV